MKNELTLNKKEFQTFLNALSEISDNAIVEVKDDWMSAIATSEDRSLFLWARLKGDWGFDCVLNLPSLRQLSKAISLITSDEFILKLNSNNLEYKGAIKFKYHLYDEGILPKSKLTTKKIESFDYNHSIDITKSFVKNILKTKTIFSKTNKLYLYTDNGEIWWSLQDKTMANSDTFTISGGDVDFELDDDFIIKLDNLSLISFAIGETIKLQFNTKIGIANFRSETDTLKLDYIASTLTK